MPPWSPLIDSSRGEHSMPSDITPRISRRPKGSSKTGTRAPGGAQGTRSPAAMFRTPTTSSTSPAACWRRATQSVSEFG